MYFFLQRKKTLKVFSIKEKRLILRFIKHGWNLLQAWDCEVPLLRRWLLQRPQLKSLSYMQEKHLEWDQEVKIESNWKRAESIQNLINIHTCYQGGLGSNISLFLSTWKKCGQGSWKTKGLSWAPTRVQYGGKYLISSWALDKHHVSGPWQHCFIRSHVVLSFPPTIRLIKSHS